MQCHLDLKSSFQGKIEYQVQQGHIDKVYSYIIIFCSNGLEDYFPENGEIAYVLG